MTTPTNGLVPAVGYLRASTLMQDTSCADQKAEIEKFAGLHDYRIIRWYTDDVISGDRGDFLRLIADSARRDFQVVLVWHSSRFSRAKPREAIGWLNDLKDSGVDLVTLDRGRLDLDNFGTLLSFSVESYGNHKFLQDRARDALRGTAKAAASGVGCKPVPFGYVKVITDELGREVKRFRAGEKGQRTGHGGRLAV